ncbi:ATP-binding protein [Candidatus Venteria ishoeyi]|uniref:ATP-binding protein n=1 Tax=Candidatus Venteria ishoeyi TaxID=1899563 RepID=UPI0025A62ED7|nr:ATP-binding protein [Candidatus Venteria ishoeyi]MDM8546366.1 ATP-binding protein [Candidatus Venteria ishoeyi]
MEKNKQARYFPLKYTVMLAILLLILPILAAISVFNFYDTQEDLERTEHLLQQQTESHILNAVQMAETGYQVLEQNLDETFRQGLSIFNQAYENAGGNLSKLDLAALQMQLNQEFELSIINPQGSVEYTTNKKEWGLDFTQHPNYYQHLQLVLHEGCYINEGVKNALHNGLLGNDALLPTQDKRYLLRLSLKQDVFQKLSRSLDLLEITHKLRIITPALENIRIFSRNGQVWGQPDFKANAALKAIVRQVYETQTLYEFKNQADKRHTRYLYVQPRNFRQNPLRYEENNSKVLELTYNTYMIDDSLQRKTDIHILITMLAIALTFISALLLSAWITQPIARITRAVNIIAQGNLSYPLAAIPVRHELVVLKQSILIMNENLHHSMVHIKKQNEELKTLDHLKDDFLSNTSHELRTPLNGIIGIADSMIAGATGNLPERTRQNLAMISMSGRRLSSLINNILDFSQLKYEHLELQLKPLEVKVLADIVLTLSGTLKQAKRLQLINKLPAGLLVKADENRLQQVFYNLIGNAIKFTEVGYITITAKQLGEMIEISIEDTGIGIPQEQLAHIFNSFEQADSSSQRSYGGAGLGLSITHKLVELHHGCIQVQSKVGQGTTVLFTLPKAYERSKMMQTMREPLKHLKWQESILFANELQEQETEAADRKLAGTLYPDLPTTPDNENDIQVLIVDDDPVNLQVLENQLSLENYRITRAYDGPTALNIIDKNKGLFSIVLLDIMMPKMSGFEVCRILRQTYPPTDLPVIMLTAKNQINDLVEGFQSGANDYLSKPFSRKVLLARIQAHINLTRTTKAYSHFVPHEFLHLLGKESITDVYLGDHAQKKMTILFIDIRNFTYLSEQMTPKENFDFINEYLGYLSPVIRDHHGFIDKYIGDAMMALFPEKPDDGLSAAIELLNALNRFNEKRQTQERKPIQVGISLHIGSLMLGTIGESQRMDGTVISDAVNLTARLEDLNKLYGSQIIISEQLLDALAPDNLCMHRFLGRVQVKGKEQKVNIYEILDGLPEVDKNIQVAQIEDFEAALEAYFHGDFKQAQQQLQQLQEQSPNDQAIYFYLEKCAQYFHRRNDKQWTEIELLQHK